MATLLQISLLIFTVFLGNLELSYSQTLTRALRSHSLCSRGTRPGQERDCFVGSCPSGWRRHRYNNYLMCWAAPNTMCCEREITPPPPVTTPLPTVNHPLCGTLGISTRIALGEDETKCESPWQASLRRVLDPSRPKTISNSNHVAGGVLVQDKWVLTTPLSTLFAGRNTANEQFSDQMVVSLGDFNHQNTEGDEQLIGVRNVFFHRNFAYSPDTDFTFVIGESFLSNTDTVWQENAFALIELESPVNINNCVRPVCLPNGNEERCTTDPCKITGWGANENEELKDILQKAPMTVLGSDACEALEVYLNRTATEVPYPARTGCAVSEQGSFACVGDFGGPVVCQGTNVNSPRTVEGLAVTKLDCDSSVIPMRVSLVREAMEWIEETILNNP